MEIGEGGMPNGELNQEMGINGLLPKGGTYESEKSYNIFGFSAHKYAPGSSRSWIGYAQPVPYLATGAVATRRISATVPPSIPVGTYYIIAYTAGQLH